MEEYMKQILTNISHVNDKLNSLDSRISNIENKNNTDKGDIELRICQIDLDINTIKKYLELNNLKGDLKLIKRIYFTNTNSPIRIMPNKNIEYWLNGSWNVNNEYLKNTLIENIKLCYLKANIFENYQDDGDTETFLNNQIHINKLSDDKYREKFWKTFINTFTK